MASPVYISTNTIQGFPFSTSLPILTFCVFDNGHPNIYEVICISLMISDMDHFSCTCWPFSFFGKVSIQVLCSLFKLVCVLFAVECRSCLHTSDINPLSVVLFTNIFSRFIRLSFHFAVHKLFSLM